VRQTGVGARRQGKRVVELGCGCGLVGLVFAALGAQALLTDLAAPQARRCTPTQGWHPSQRWHGAGPAAQASRLKANDGGAPGLAHAPGDRQATPAALA